MTVELTIIGLNRLGASFGLALAAHKAKVHRRGIDRDPAKTDRAVKLGALDAAFHNLPSSVKEADLILIAAPTDELRITLELIAPVLKEGAVVLSTAPTHEAAHRWASELFGNHRYLLGFTPTLNPAYLSESGNDLSSAHADLFQHSQVWISDAPNTDPAAVKLASDLCELLGAQACHTTDLEADGLLANSEILPRLGATALVLTTTSQPGWREARKTAGRAYATATHADILLEDGASLAQMLLLNRESSLRMIDQYIGVLQSLRNGIAEQDENILQQLFAQASEQRQAWESARKHNDWEPKLDVETPSLGDILGRMVGIRPRKPSA